MGELDDAPRLAWHDAGKRLAVAGRLMREGFGSELCRALGIRLYSRTLSVGLRRDLRVDHTTPYPRVPVAVRALRPDDDLSFLDPTPRMAGREALMCVGLRHRARVEPETCWVAEASDGRLCYIQWLIPYHRGWFVAAEWGDLFPPLRPGEALMEGGYTAPPYRGNGIMAYAMDQIARAAAATSGIRWVLGFVHRDNIASLKSAQRAGLVPFLERVERWLLFRRTVRFRPPSAGTS